MADDTTAPRLGGGGDYRWQGQDMDTGGGGSARRFWFVVLAGLFLALGSLVIVWILLLKPPPPPPYLLTINIGEYDARQYPVVGFASYDPKTKMAETKTKGLFLDQLKGLASKKDPIVLHISALALVRDGKIYVLPGDAKPNDESTWLELREIVSLFGKCPAKKKLLILDIAHPLADARLGVLTDRVAETLEDHFKNDPPPFWVICPCSAGQYSLHSETVNGSVFAYYLRLGLQYGQADLDKDLRIYVSELFTFLEARVDRWAQTNRGLRQKPRRFGKGEDFILKSLDTDPLGEPETAELAAYPASLQEGWKARDQWWSKEAFRLAPRGLLKLNANLLRQERLWPRSSGEKKDLELLEADADSLLKRELPRAMKFRAAPPRSLALALAQTGTKENPALFDAALYVLGSVKDSQAKKDINAKVEEELVKKLQEPKGVDFVQQGRAIMEALSGLRQLQADHVRVALSALDKLKPKQGYVDYIETFYLQRLIAFADDVQDKNSDVRQWRPEMAQGILQAMLAHETAVAALDREPAFLPWVASALKEADELRWLGEKRLIWDAPSQWKRGLEELQSAKAKYVEAKESLDTLRLCRWNLDRAFAELPAYMKLVCDWPDLDPQAEQAWGKAAKEAETLQAFFIHPPELTSSREKNRLVVADLYKHGDELARQLKDLAKTLDRRIKRALKEDNAESLHQLLLLEQSPLLTAEVRGMLFKERRKLAARLHTQTEKLDKEDNEQRRVVPLPDAARQVAENDVGRLRAAMSLALLRLAGFEDREKTLVLPAEGQATAQLEKAFQTAWSEDLPAQWEKARPESFVGDSLNRIVSPWEEEKQQRTGEKDASRQLQGKVRSAFLQWLEERYQAAGAIAQEPQVGEFYRDAAREVRVVNAD